MWAWVFACICALPALVMDLFVCSGASGGFMPPLFAAFLVNSLNFRRKIKHGQR